MSQERGFEADGALEPPSAGVGADVGTLVEDEASKYNNLFGEPVPGFVILLGVAPSIIVWVTSFGFIPVPRYKAAAPQT
jgi:hypothetical protein